MNYDDWKQRGKFTHVFWSEEHLVEFIDYLRLSRPFVD